ncbi:sodium:calcium antiporter [Fulvitalea axinellae]|uniref:Sodium:calcium antiporter n=1 Tax=Fulvitalea axinellae TaxID=1182444 RepID=A0AAU9CNN6_9BACT|nr:sodium:calcium antiporter [Fulvitalea axinellae]
MITDIVMLVVGLCVLIFGGDFLVKGSSRIALGMNIPPFIVGLTVIAFGTSAPELFISVQSALAGSSDIAIGNVIGSDICNLGLVLGLTAIICPISVGKNSIKMDWPVMMFSAIMVYVFALEGEFKAWEGAVSFAILIVYLFYTVTKGRKKALVETEDPDLLEAEDHPYPKWRSILYMVLGAIGLYFGSEWFVGSAKTLAVGLGVSERVIGVTIVALGTSLPELVTSVISAFRKQTDLALGNLLGSNIFNNLAILGATAMVKPIGVGPEILRVDMVWMLLFSLAVLPMMVSRKSVSKVEGVILLGSYGVYTYFVLV